MAVPGSSTANNMSAISSAGSSAGAGPSIASGAYGGTAGGASAPLHSPLQRQSPRAARSVHMAPVPSVAEYECGVGNGRIGTTNSATLKRHPKMELNKNDMLRLLSYLEGELQAREVVIATLKSEKAKQLLYQAKYGRFGLGDPFIAIQRDNDGVKDSSFDENAVKQLYENQLGQLEHLIAVQRKAQIKLRDQMKNAEVKCHKIHSELDDEKRKHAQDMAQGDDVTYALGKDRERLKDEIEFERSQNKKLEKELKKVQTQLEQEQTNANKHKQVAIMLIKERRQLAEKLNLERRRSRMLEVHLLEERQKVKKMAEGLMEESRKSVLMEATMEKQMSEFDTQSEQYKQKLAREEKNSKKLAEELDRVQNELAKANKMEGVERPREAPQSVEIKTSTKTSPLLPRSPAPVRLPRTPEPAEHYSTTLMTGPDPQPVVLSASPTPPATMTQSADGSSYRVLLKPGDGAAGGTTFTLPAGGKVSVTVGGATSPYHRRARRGSPPPVPPNKPQILPGGLVRRAAEAFERPTSP